MVIKIILDGSADFAFKDNSDIMQTYLLNDCKNKKSNFGHNEK